jgi:hypothetical protein
MKAIDIILLILQISVIVLLWINIKQATKEIKRIKDHINRLNALK